MILFKFPDTDIQFKNYPSVSKQFAIIYVSKRVTIFQDSADVISAVSEPAHLVAHQRMQHSIIIRPTAVRAISTDIICQTIVQHCRTSDLELTATCRVKLRLSLNFQIQTQNSSVFYCFLLTILPTCSASASVAA